MRLLLHYVVLLLATLPAVAAHAAPLRLTLQPQAGQLQFNYRFEFEQQPQQLSFTIGTTTLNGHFRQFRALKPALLQQYLWRDLRAHVASHPGARLIRQPNKIALRYQLTANN